MNTYKAVQFMAGVALAVGMNGLAMAHSVDLNSGAAATVSVATVTGNPASAFTAPRGVVSMSYHAVGHSTSIDNLMRAGFVVPNGDFKSKLCFWFCPIVPEPSVYLLMLSGVGLVCFMAYRRQRQGIPTGTLGV